VVGVGWQEVFPSALPGPVRYHSLPAVVPPPHLPPLSQEPRRFRHLLGVEACGGPVFVHTYLLNRIPISARKTHRRPPYRFCRGISGGFRRSIFNRPTDEWQLSLTRWERLSSPTPTPCRHPLLRCGA